MTRKTSFLTLVCGVFAQKGTKKYVSSNFFSYNSIVKTGTDLQRIYNGPTTDLLLWYKRLQVNFFFRIKRQTYTRG